MSRFDFTTKELSTIHHALRMLALNPDEKANAEPLADEAWAEICDRSAEKHTA